MENDNRSQGTGHNNSNEEEDNECDVTKGLRKRTETYVNVYPYESEDNWSSEGDGSGLERDWRTYNRNKKIYMPIRSTNRIMVGKIST